MFTKHLAFWAAVGGVLAFLVTGCSGGGGSGGAAGAAGRMDVVLVSNGFGTMIPHQVFRPDSQGNPTAEVVAIRSHADLLDNVLPTNPILAPTGCSVSFAQW